MNFIGRRFTHTGDSIVITLTNNYIEDMLADVNMTNCKPTTTTGTTTLKANLDGANALDIDEHKQFRKMVGKLQWLALVRTDIHPICYKATSSCDDCTDCGRRTD